METKSDKFDTDVINDEDNLIVKFNKEADKEKLK